MDNILNWNEHIQVTIKKINKSKKALFAAKTAIGKRWGFSSKQIIWIYKTTIIPILSYGSVVWATNLTKSKISKITTIKPLLSI